MVLSQRILATIVLRTAIGKQVMVMEYFQFPATDFLGGYTMLGNYLPFAVP